MLNAQDVRISNLEKRTSLDGKWALYVGSLEDSSSVSSVDFPQINFFYPEDRSNTYWFVRTFHVDPHLKKSPLGLYLGRLPDACQVYFNGSLLLESGSQPPAKYFPSLFFSNSLILPDGVVRYGEENELVLKVYSERTGTILSSMFIATPEYVAVYKYRINILNSGLGFLSTAITLITALYFFVLFLMNKSNRKYLFMTLGSLGFAVNSSILYVTSSLLPYLTLLKIQFAGLYWGTACILIFVSHIMKSSYLRILQKILVIGSAVMTLALVLMPDLKSALFFNDRIVYLFWISPLLLLLFIVVLQGVRKKIHFSSIILFGVMLALGGAVRDIIHLQLDSPPDFFTNLLGLLLLIISIFITFAAQFIDAEQKLRKFSQNLEDLVRQRTVELEKANSRLSEQVVTDILTGAYNRLEFSRVMENEDARYRRSERKYAAIYMDLDNFKYINDTFGHPAGDLILLEVSKVLKGCTRSSDYLFRMGGDEFLILMTDISNGRDALTLAERIFGELINRQFFLPELISSLGRDIQFPKGKNLSLSMGISTTDAVPPETLQDLTIQADLALLDAKSQGKNRYALYQQDS